MRVLIDPIGTGAEPHPDVVRYIVETVAKRYPHGGNQLCAAAALAIDLAWAARHEIARLQLDHALADHI